MEPTRDKDLSNAGTKVASQASEATRRGTMGDGALRERASHVRDLVEDLRDRAEIAFHERPYLLPVATGALGLGLGVLIGSKLSRFLIVAAAGAMMNERVRRQIVRAGREILNELGKERSLSYEEADDIEDLEEPSVT
jgi:hypothetical protein